MAHGPLSLLSQPVTARAENAARLSGLSRQRFSALALSGSANRAQFGPELGVNLPYIGAIASSAHDSIPDVPREACLPAISPQQAIFTHISVGMPINRGGPWYRRCGGAKAAGRCRSGAGLDPIARQDLLCRCYGRC